MARHAAAEESKDVGRRSPQRSGEVTAKMMMTRLRKLKWFPEVPPREWKQVYRELSGRELKSKDFVYTEIKRMLKVEKRKVMRQKDPRQAE